MKNFLKNNYVIISIIGPAAGETVAEILERKKGEIERTGRSFWLYRSYRARPSGIQDLCKESLSKKNSPICIFIKPATENGAQPTRGRNIAKEFSKDGNSWEKIPKGVLVTGLVPNASAMIFDKLDDVERGVFLNLWDYSQFLSPGRAVRIIRGASTIRCIRKSSRNDPDRMGSNIREVVAIGRLVKPFSVWLR